MFRIGVVPSWFMQLRKLFRLLSWSRSQKLTKRALPPLPGRTGISVMLFHFISREMKYIKTNNILASSRDIPGLNSVELTSALATGDASVLIGG